MNCTLEIWKEVTEDAYGKSECDYLGNAFFSHYVKFPRYFLNTDERIFLLNFLKLHSVFGVALQMHI